MLFVRARLNRGLLKAEILSVASESTLFRTLEVSTTSAWDEPEDALVLLSVSAIRPGSV
jgi:hypothetical protein